MDDWWEEKRRFPRVKLNTALSYQVRGINDINNTVGQDISLGGMAAIIDKFINCETLLNLKIKVLSRVLSAVGKVAWVSPLPHANRFRVGIEFIEIDAWDKSYLSDYISMQSKG